LGLKKKRKGYRKINSKRGGLNIKEKKRGAGEEHEKTRRSRRFPEMENQEIINEQETR